MKKGTNQWKLAGVFLMTALLMFGCGKSATTSSSSSSESSSTAKVESSTEGISKAAETESTKLPQTQISVFIAASLSNAMDEVTKAYNENQPNVKINYNADSSGTLMTQIEEGAACDIFFSAATSQMDELVQKGLIEDNTRVDLLNNKVVLIATKGNNTQVKGFDTLNKAKSIAIAGGSVPVGKYTRKILMNEGILTKVDDPSTITTQQISDALGGVEINECSNVSKVTEAVKEGANEVGTVYYSDAYSVKDDVDIIATADKSLAGDIIYPVAEVKNTEATADETAAAKDFEKFLQTDQAKEIFKKYMFEINGQ